jgi:DNA-directed RNA polymerase subunit L
MLIQLSSPDPVIARSARRPDHTAAALIRPQLRRSATAEAAVYSIDHNDVAAV